MKRLFAFLMLIAAFGGYAAAQSTDEPGSAQWVKEVREFKHSFLARELGLTREQESRFFKVYDAMEDEVAQINSDTRQQERRLLDAPDGQITDLEYDQAVQALFELKKKEADIELRYLPELKEVLNKKQLFKLKSVERKFSMTLMRRHHDLKKGGDKATRQSASKRNS